MNDMQISAGTRFGKLTTTSQVRTSSSGHTVYLCVCDCEKQIGVRAATLKNKEKAHCGCSSKDESGNRRSHKSFFDKILLDDSEKIKRNLYNSSKHNAKKRGYSFELTFEEYIALASQNCNYCGREPKHIIRDGVKSDVLANGIDRYDNKKGYCLDNCIPCCRICNIAKNNLTIAEWNLWIKDLCEFQAKINFYSQEA
jgi:hypothetical protein